MKLVTKRRLRSGFVDRRNGCIYEVVTERLKFEPNYMFEKRHDLKVKAKKYWLRNLIK